MPYRMDGLRSARLTAVSATAQIGSGGNGTITLTIVATGGAGNGYTVRAVLGAGNDVALSAALVGLAITITLGTDAEGLADDTKNTATLITAVLDALTGIDAATSGSGATPISAAFSAVAFSGGRDIHTIDRLAKLAGFRTGRLIQVERGRPVEPEEAARLADALATTLVGLSAVAL